MLTPATALPTRSGVPNTTAPDEVPDVAARNSLATTPNARILSIESAFPEFSGDLDLATANAQALSCETEKQASKVAKLYRRAGVEHRGSVLLNKVPPNNKSSSREAIELIQDERSSIPFYPPLSESVGGPTTRERNERFSTEAPDLVCRASSTALKSAGCAPSQVTHLITVTCTGFYSPGIDIELIETLGLPPTTQRTQIGFMGCHALINAFRVAQGLVASDTSACVLIASVELCSLHYQYGYDAQKIVSGSLFADGAAGVVVAGREFEPAEITVTNPSWSANLGISATGSCLIPKTQNEMTWKIGDHGFEMTLSAAVPGLIEKNLRPYLEGWLAGQGETIESIQGWAVHPGGTRIVQAVQNALGLADEQLAIPLEVLRQHGNMSSATLGAVLKQYANANISRPWLMLGFGPGLEIEVALLR